jgi:3',5'-cyclic AMP phosphodiesterase CpdA
MFTIFLISDVHTEFYNSASDVFDNITWPEATHLVLAGDIGCVSTKFDILREFLEKCRKKYENVIFIPGNHEYYHCDTNHEIVEKKLEELCTDLNVHYVHRKNKVVSGIRFIGHTLWSIIDRHTWSKISDSTFRVFDSQIDYVSAFVDGYKFLKNEIANSVNSAEPIVVVTHHLPSRKLIHSKFSTGTDDSAFATDVISHLHFHNVKYWFCGHSHEFGEMKYGNTFFALNPVGYPNEKRVTTTSDKVYKLI